VLDGTLICIEALLRAEGIWDRELEGAGDVIMAWQQDAKEED